MKIYIIRHGQATGDIEDRYGGAYDDELTDTGKTQAQELASKLSDSGIQILYCSPLIRAQQTAEILKAKLDCEIKTIESTKPLLEFYVDDQEAIQAAIKNFSNENYLKAILPKLPERQKDLLAEIELIVNNKNNL